MTVFNTITLNKRTKILLKDVLENYIDQNINIQKDNNSENENNLDNNLTVKEKKNNLENNLNIQKNENNLHNNFSTTLTFRNEKNSFSDLLSKLKKLNFYFNISPEFFNSIAHSKKKKLLNKQKSKKFINLNIQNHTIYKQFKTQKLSFSRKLSIICNRELKRAFQRTSKINPFLKGRKIPKYLTAYQKKCKLNTKKLKDEMQEKKREENKMNFLLNQTELFAHFVLKGEKEKLEEIRQNLQNKSNSRINNENNNYNTISENNINNDSRVGIFKEPPFLSYFQGTLKSYQKKGLSWMISLFHNNINGILADDMGLGKTVQTLSLLSYLYEYENKFLFLIVTPVSTIGNWESEIQRFLPKFKIVNFVGSDRSLKEIHKNTFREKNSKNKNKNSVENKNSNSSENLPIIVLTSYNLISDKKIKKIKFDYLICDEAQAIKSSKSLRWKNINQIISLNRILLTGTPIQNNMAELWSLLHFIMPTLFSDHLTFISFFSNEKSVKKETLKRLHLILKPFMLRREKNEVKNELGKKIEKEILCEMTEYQKKIYKQVNNFNDENVCMQLRKIVNHPCLYLKSENMSGFFIEDEEKKYLSDQGGTDFLNNILDINKNCNINNDINDILDNCNINNDINDILDNCKNLEELENNKNININIENMEDANIIHSKYDLQISHTEKIIESKKKVLFNPFYQFKLKNGKIINESEFIENEINCENENNCEIEEIIFNGVKKENEKFNVLKDSEFLFDPNCTMIRKIRNENGDSIYTKIDENQFDSSSVKRIKFNENNQKNEKFNENFNQMNENSIFQEADNFMKNKFFIKNGLPVSSENFEEREPTFTEIQNYLSLKETDNYLLEKFKKEITPNVFGNESIYIGNKDSNSGDNYNVLDQNIVFTDNENNILEKPNLLNIPDLNLKDSGKFRVLHSLLKKLKDKKILIYFQMTKMMDLFENYCKEMKYSFLRLDGQLKYTERKKIVDTFQNENIFLFLLSTRAGGLGLNLTTANTVIFYDSDWNPTVDQQAMDRAYRIGNNNDVVVYRLVTKDSIEMKMRDSCEMKEEIHRLVIDGGEYTL